MVPGKLCQICGVDSKAEEDRPTSCILQMPWTPAKPNRFHHKLHPQSAVCIITVHPLPRQLHYQPRPSSVPVVECQKGERLLGT